MRPQLTTTFLFSLAASALANHDQLVKRQSQASSAPAASGTVVVGVTIPPLAQITMGMPTQQVPVATRTAPPGATPPIAGAPTLPSPAWSFVQGQWPAMDKPIDTSTDQVKEWMKELDGYNIPDLKPTVDGSCANDTAAAANASARGWWTCGGYTRATDITACPTKLQWGVSFDDGPSPYTTNLLTYLHDKNISATFFVVGSRVISYPDILINEYMAGHEIAVHTWSHPHLTALTNEQIVAELGWTRHAIKSVLGVTPTTMRPPYGDIDDRVRMISLAMGLVPIIWTRTPSGASFDTFDWRVAGGVVDGTTSFNTFQNILSNATTLDTGFCVLQHDLYEITVDLALGYTMNAALSHNPAFNLESIGRCNKIPATNMFVESNVNKSFPFPSPPASMAGQGGNSSTNGKVSSRGGAGGSSDAQSLRWSALLAAGALASTLLFA
ncbi:NodB-like proteiny domain-containing protein [Mycena indigotica]|uniref:chitin deacetylase n=1 Tax=Mycena indigotica TaxID=2126181 RepID=A0A8H6SEB3_9AGAR|nr:NodB-like proteiny domain-containing protein [Mycena indigotica]KAF7297161.1 NodB-like proteiny domain-containing protein [Mycena indigotica]